MCHTSSSCAIKTSGLIGMPSCAIGQLWSGLNSQSLFLGPHQRAPFLVMPELYPQALHGGCQSAPLRALFSRLPSLVLLPCASCSLAGFSVRCITDTGTLVRNHHTDHKPQSSLQRWLWAHKARGFWQPNPESYHRCSWTPKANIQINCLRERMKLKICVYAFCNL